MEGRSLAEGAVLPYDVADGEDVPVADAVLDVERQHLEVRVERLQVGDVRAAVLAGDVHHQVGAVVALRLLPDDLDARVQVVVVDEPVMERNVGGQHLVLAAQAGPEVRDQPGEADHDLGGLEQPAAMEQLDRFDPSHVRVLSKRLHRIVVRLHHMEVRLEADVSRHQGAAVVRRAVQLDGQLIAVQSAVCCAQQPDVPFSHSAHFLDTMVITSSFWST